MGRMIGKACTCASGCSERRDVRMTRPVLFWLVPSSYSGFCTSCLSEWRDVNFQNTFPVLADPHRFWALPKDWVWFRLGRRTIFAYCCLLLLSKQISNQNEFHLYFQIVFAYTPVSCGHFYYAAKTTRNLNRKVLKIPLSAYRNLFTSTSVHQKEINLTAAFVFEQISFQ